MLADPADSGGALKDGVAKLKAFVACAAAGERWRSAPHVAVEVGQRRLKDLRAADKVALAAEASEGALAPYRLPWLLL